MTREDIPPYLPAAAGLGLFIMLGLIAGGYLLGTEVRDFKRADRYVAVKGLVERTVKSDSATWTLSFKEPGDYLPSVLAASEKDKGATLDFLSHQGFHASEVTVDAVHVTDRSTAQYGSNEHGPRYIVQQTITVQTNDVDKIGMASSKTAELVKAGVVLNSERGGDVVYTFNGLNALKPDMITEATRNARASANRFAADSGSQVGSIRDANQGVFSISAASDGPSINDDSGGGYNADQQADSSMMKKIRVVCTIDYYLVK